MKHRRSHVVIISGAGLCMGRCTTKNRGTQTIDLCQWLALAALNAAGRCAKEPLKRCGTCSAQDRLK